MDRGQLPLSRCLAVALAVMALAAITTANAAIHKWVDAQGRVHFDDREPGAPDALKSFGSAPTAGAESRLDIGVTPHGWDLAAENRARMETGIRRIHEVYTGLFHLEMRRHVNIDIHLFPDAGSMTAYVAQQDPSLRLPPGVLGLYVPRLDAIFAWAHDADESTVVATLLHESSHVMLERLSPNAPPWLHEGLAQYFQGLDLDAEDDIVLRPEPHAAAIIDRMVQQRQLITLRDYFALSPDRWRHLAYSEQNPIPYPVAWSIAYFLMSRPAGRQIVGELLQDLEKTKRGPTEATIQARYPGGYPMMEYDWFKWAQQEKQPQTLRW